MTNAGFKKLGSSGPEVLLLHGWQHSIENLWELGKCLSKHCQVYLVKLPGFGGEELESDDWSTADYVQYVKDLIEQEQIKPVLVGHSFGGRIAVKLAALYLQNYFQENLVLIGTPGIPTALNPIKRVRLWILKYTAKILKIIDKIFRTSLFENKFVPRFASNDYRNAGTLKKLLVKTLKENLTPYAIRIRKKTLLLWGKNDKQAPIEQAYAYQRLIRGSKLRVLPYHGHEPFSDVGAHYTSKIIHRFINASA